MNTIHPLLTSRYGCWISGRVPFSSKIDAVTHASSNNTQVSFYYHNHVWEHFDRSKLGKTPLSVLYRERAQQLRDSYNYLVLHYSGGADSHNILRTFIDNNIKLDEITVRWPKALRDGKFYTPNKQDTSARNAASEWDYAIQPTLKWLGEFHPNIKINVVDYAYDLKKDNVDADNIENTLLNANFSRGSMGTISMIIDPNVKKTLLSINKNKIAHIFGIDKPILISKDDSIYMRFMDGVFEHTMPIRDQEDGSVVEPFYWSPDLPELPMEQAYQSALHFKHNKKIASALWRTEEILTDSRRLEIFEEQGHIHKFILYADTWNSNTFQVKKPNAVRSDWYFWLFERPEYLPLLNNYIDVMKNISSGLNPKFFLTSKNINLLEPSRTPLFHILS
jgi:hypothetical protein